MKNLSMPSEYVRCCHSAEQLEKVARAVFADLISRNVKYLEKVSYEHKYQWIDLPCPTFALEPIGIYAVLIDFDESTNSVFMAFRKRLETNLSYQGFYPFGLPASDLAMVSLCCAVDLTFEYCRQMNVPWSLPAVLAKYPDVKIDDCFVADFQRFGFEVLGYDPVTWSPPYQIYGFEGAGLG